VRGSSSISSSIIFSFSSKLDNIFSRSGKPAIYFPLSKLVSILLFLNISLISFVLKSGLKDFITEISQTICGVAIEVQLSFLYQEFGIVE
jgi:uncharacterized membrane protein YesL